MADEETECDNGEGTEGKVDEDGVQGRGVCEAPPEEPVPRLLLQGETHPLALPRSPYLVEQTANTDNLQFSL